MIDLDLSIYFKKKCTSYVNVYVLISRLFRSFQGYIVLNKSVHN